MTEDGQGFLATTETVETDEDVKAVEDLTKDVAQKHRKKKRKLKEQLQKDLKDGNVDGQLEELMQTSQSKLRETVDKKETTADIGDASVSRTVDKPEPAVDDTPKTKKTSRKAQRRLEKEKLEKERELAQTMTTLRSGMETTTRFDKVAMEGLVTKPAIFRQEHLQMTWSNMKDKTEIPEELQEAFFKESNWPVETEEGAPITTDAGEEGTSKVDDDKETTPLIKRDHPIVEGRPIFMSMPELPLESADDTLFFYPSRDPPQLPNQEAGQLIDLSEEGLYVGRKPHVSKVNKNRLMQILTHTSDKYPEKLKWIGEDGDLLMLPDPLKDVPMRPLIFEDQLENAPPHLQTLYVPARSWSTPYNTDLTTTWLLEIDISSIRISNHHLFSEEHVKVAEMEKLYNDYAELMRLNFTSYFAERILAVKRAITELEKQISVQSNSPHPNEMVLKDYKERLVQYWDELELTRKSKIRKEALHYKLCVGIVNSWAQVKQIRRRVGFTSTSAQLKIKEITHDKAEDEDNQRMEIKDWTMERLTVQRRSYEEKLSLYQAEKAKLDAERKANKEKRDKNRELGMEDAVDEDDDDAEESLVPPDEPDAALVESEINKFVKDGEDIESQETYDRRKPGEPGVKVKLVRCPVAAQPVPDQIETRRRTDLEDNYRYSVRMAINEKIVGETDDTRLDADTFTLTFNRVFPVDVVEFPDTVKLTLVEKVRGAFGRWSQRDVADVYAPRLTSQVTLNQINLEEYEFSGAFPPKVLPAFRAITDSRIIGNLKFRCGWSTDSDNNILAPPKKVYNPSSETYHDEQVGANIDDSRRARELFTKMVDPNDPDMIVSPLKPVEGKLVDPETFTLSYMDEDFAVCSEEDFLEDPRSRALILRAQKDKRVENMKIPLHFNEFSDELKKIIQVEATRPTKEEPTKASGMDALRKKYQTKIAHLREKVNEAFLRSLDFKSYNEVISEIQVPNVNIFAWITPMFRRQRPLMAQKEVTQPQMASNLLAGDKQLYVVVKVKSAANLYIRADSEKHPELPKLQPFVEVSFQGRTKKTKPQVGATPVWDTVISLPYTPKPGVDLEAASDTIVMNVYDDLSKEIRDVTSNETRLIKEKHFLGNLTVPLSTVYLNQVVAGWLNLSTPARIFKYEPGKLNSPEPALEIVINLEPMLSRPGDVEQNFESYHLPEHLGWVRETKKMVSDVKRQFVLDVNMAQMDATSMSPDAVFFYPRAFVVNGDCKELFVSLYINENGLAYPEELFKQEYFAPDEGNVQKMFVRKQFLLARYVSLVPYVTDAEAFPGMVDIWNTCEDFLEYQVGDEEEHAVLLCNFFIALCKKENNDSKIYLALGTGIPEGSSAYVLVANSGGTDLQSSNRIFVWNPTLGTRFEILNERCPLRSIDCLITHDSVYVNKLQMEPLKKLQIDVNNTNNWMRLTFPTNVDPQSGYFNSVNAKPIDYATAANINPDTVEFEIETTIRTAIKTWRSKIPTMWMESGSRKIKDFLKCLEKHYPYYENEEVSRMYQQLVSGFEVNTEMIAGYPIHMCYMDNQELLQQVRNTGIHERTGVPNPSNTRQNPTVHFSVVVLVNALPKNVLSIWVFLAAFQRNR